MTTASRVSAWTRHMAHLRGARAFLEACAAEGVAALPVKGIVTAHLLYDDPVERPLTDVDVRIRPRDYARVGDIARRRGWRFVETKRAYRNYVLRVEGIEIDVECHVGPPHVCSLRVEDLLARAATNDALGFAARLPDFVDHATLLVVNVFKDKLVLARDWALADLERIAMHPAFDAKALAARLRESRAATIGWVVANHFAVERGLANWAAVREALSPLERRVYATALARARRRPAKWPSIVLARLGSDDRVERMRALLTMGRWAITR